MTTAFQPRVATLDERYQRQDGTIYLTGIQALVRVLLDRARHDRERGITTASYVSGYEGSPLGGYDLELARHRDLLSEYGIVHQPGLNEELAATAVSGTQLAGRVGDARHDGVTGVWYGKAPGLDRATDAPGKLGSGYGRRRQFLVEARLVHDAVLAEQVAVAG